MMPHLKQRCFIFCLLSFFCSPVFSLIKKKYEIHDLVSTDATSFAAEVAEWEVEGNRVSTLYTTCGTALLLGGPGILERMAYFKRTYKDLDSHNGISGQISFWLIDNWRDIDDMIFLRIFDEVSTNIYYNRVLAVNYNAAAWGTSDCGNSFSDLKNAKLNFRFPHSGSTITFQFYGTHPMDSNPASFGIRDVKILLHKDSPGLAVCGQPGNIYLTNYGCSTCADTQWYKPWVGCVSCKPYDAACTDDNNNPFACKSDATLVAQDPSNCYCAPCDSSCLTCSVANSNKDCLSCQSGRHLFKNATCLTNCPYTITTVGSISYCDFPCLSLTATEYLFENGTCMTTCPTPYVVRDVVIGKHCEFPCSPNGFAFPDDGCRSTCDLPMKTVIEQPMIKFCVPPCNETAYYYFEDATCRYNCPYPREIKKNEFYFYCAEGSSTARTFAALTSVMNGRAAEVINKGFLAASFIFLGQSWGIFVGAYTRLFQNVRYINASYGTHTELMVENWKTSLMTLEFFPAVPEAVQESVPTNPTIVIFQIYGIHTSFLVSAWRACLSVLLMLVIYILVRFIEWMATKSNQTNTIIRYLRILAQNSLIITFYGNFGYFVVYSVVEYRSLNLNNSNGLSILSFIAAIVFLLAVLISLILHFILLRKRKRLVTKATWTENYSDLKAFTKAYAGFQVLFIDFKDKFQSFLFISMLRDMICNLTVATLTNYPLHQAGIMSVFGVVWIFYLYSNRPLRRLLDQIQHTFHEVLLLIANGGAFVITVLDDVENDDLSLREIIAKAIMFSTMIYSFSVFGFFGLKAANMIYDIYKIRTAMKNPNSVVDKEALAQQQGILGDMLGLDPDAVDAVSQDINQDRDDRDSSFLGNDSRLESNALIRSEKGGRALRLKRPMKEHDDTPSGIIDEYYKKKELVMDSSSLRVHVGRFGKGKQSEKDLNYNKKHKYRNDNYGNELSSLPKDGRKNLSDFRPKGPKDEEKKKNKNSNKMPETDLRCKEKLDYDEDIRREQAQTNLNDYKYPGFL